MHRTLFAAILGLVLLAGPLAVTGVSPTASAAGDCTAAVTSLADPLTAGVWQSINDTRALSGENVLVWSDSLARSTAWMARDDLLRSSAVTDIDSLGRDPRIRATDCGYRADAVVAESMTVVQTSDPFNTWIIWRQNDVSRMYAILYSPVLYPPGYAVGALGRATNSDGVTFWVLNAGSLPEGGVLPPPPPTATPVPPTATPVPPTVTNVPSTATAIPPTDTPVPFVPSSTPTSPPPADWTWCVDEGGFCGWFDGTRAIRYGADGAYVQRTLAGGLACNNDIFGDPVFGVVKHCDVGPLLAWTPTPVTPTATLVVGAPSPTPTPCAASKGRRCR